MTRGWAIVATWALAALACNGDDKPLTAQLSLTGRVEQVEFTPRPAAPVTLAQKTLRAWLKNPPSILQREPDGSYTLGEDTGEARPWSLTLRSRQVPRNLASGLPRLPDAEVTVTIDPDEQTTDTTRFGLGSRKHNLWLTLEQNDDESWTSGLQLRRSF